MSKRGGTGAIASFLIDDSSPVPIYKQILSEMRRAIISGRLPGGSRLPATRILATELGVSRNTIMSVFADLLSEGYVESRVGDGTYVANVLPEDHLLPIHATGTGSQDPIIKPDALSRRGLEMSKLAEEPLTHEIILPRPFCADLPAIEAFPVDAWSRLMTRCWQKITPTALGYVQPAGYEPLQQSIARHLGAARFVRCAADQIVVTSGSQQSLDLAARMLIDPGDSIWFEEPGYIGARSIFVAAGVRITPVPVDEQGLDVAAGKSLDPRPKLIFVSPSRQYPTGVTMSQARRQELIEFANSIGAWIIEDDYDSEFRYDGVPLPAMQSSMKAERLIYLGTFSKSLLPAFRLGYMVIPKELVTSFVTTKSIITRHAPLLEQMTLHEFMSTGQFAAHIRKMRQLYQERQLVLVNALREQMSDLVEVTPATTGMHLTAFFLREDIDDVAFCEEARRRGISLRPLSVYYMNSAKRRGIILGFASSPARRLVSGVERLANFSREFLGRHPTAGAVSSKLGDTC